MHVTCMDKRGSTALYVGGKSHAACKPQRITVALFVPPHSFNELQARTVARLKPDTAYRFRVRAKNDRGESRCTAGRGGREGLVGIRQALRRCERCPFHEAS